MARERRWSGVGRRSTVVWFLQNFTRIVCLRQCQQNSNLGTTVHHSESGDRIRNVHSFRAQFHPDTTFAPLPAVAPPAWAAISYDICPSHAPSPTASLFSRRCSSRGPANMMAEDFSAVADGRRPGSRWRVWSRAAVWRPPLQP